MVVACGWNWTQFSDLTALDCEDGCGLGTIAYQISNISDINLNCIVDNTFLKKHVCFSVFGGSIKGVLCRCGSQSSGDAKSTRDWLAATQ